MKNLSSILAILTFVLISTSVFAQEPKTVKLVQVPGEFTTSEITLKPGKYIFEVTNDGVDHEVGLVVVPKGSEGDQSKFIKEAFVTKAVAEDKTEQTQVVELKEGEYTFFCPLNPTPQYQLTVK